MSIDLSVAFHKLHQLQSEDGDLGAAYWLDVAKYLREAETLRKRAEAAEAKLEQICEIIQL
ncbi:hypothetical protein ABT364_18860 [Massilia sp. SR12]